MKKRETKREEREDDAHRVVTRKAYTLENKQGEGKGRRWAWMFIQKIADTTGNAGRTKGGKGKGKREGTMSVVKKRKKKRKKENKRRKGRKKKKGSDGKEVLSLPFPLSFSLCVVLFSLSATSLLSVGRCKERGNAAQMGMRIVRLAREKVEQESKLGGTLRSSR